MGRVRRYKKTKAIDPFAKRRSTVSGDYDEPPEVAERKKKQSEKRRNSSALDWDNEEDRERILQMEALRNLRENDSINSSTNKVSKLQVQPIKEGESLKTFNKRVKDATRKILVEEVSKLTSTAKRRKEKLKEIKEKKKLKKLSKNADSDDDLQPQEFGSRSDGFIRPSDHPDAPISFRKVDEDLKFGDVYEAPPSLELLGKQLEKKTMATSGGSVSQIVSRLKSIEDGLDDDGDDKESRKRRYQKLKMFERDDLDGDDHVEAVSKGDFGLNAAIERQRQRELSGKKKPAPQSKNQAAEMEKLRQAAIDSYRLLRERQRQQKNK